MISVGGASAGVCAVLIAFTTILPEFEVTLRVDTPEEVEYIRHGGILPFVLRELIRA